MTSIFFRISNQEYIEAMKIYDHPGKEFALRIISYKNGMEVYTYLSDVSLNELSVLAGILRLGIVQGISTVGELRSYVRNIFSNYATYNTKYYL